MSEPVSHEPAISDRWLFAALALSGLIAVVAIVKLFGGIVAAPLGETDSLGPVLMAGTATVAIVWFVVLELMLAVMRVFR